MLNDPGATTVAEAIKVTFACIARYEQDLLALRRNEAKSADTLITALENDHKIFDKILEGIVIADKAIEDAHLMLANDLLQEIAQIPEPPSPYKKNCPMTIAKFLAPLIGRAQLLDSWLEPTVNVDMQRTAEQESFYLAFGMDGHVLLEDGSVIFPRHRQSWRTDAESTESKGIFAHHLKIVAYLPSHLDSDSPDNHMCLGKPVRAHYHLWSNTELLINPVPQDPVIAIAPLAERGCDVTFVPSKCGEKYALQLNYHVSRFAEALRQAHEKGAHILLVPEMALPEGNPEDFNDRLGQLIFDAQAEYNEHKAINSQLRLIVTGVLGGERTDGVHENYAVVFDASGNQPTGFRQIKLSHWNLTKKQQKLFGVNNCQTKCQPLSDPIYENSRVAERFSVLEIPGIGRTAILLCSDMSQNNPGDWLSINAVLDWIYAPIMDKSTCWEISDKKNKPRTWIVQRTYRSARLTGTLIVTTNSMALTHWVNEANNSSDCNWPQYTEVGIGLAIDGRRNPPTHSHVVVGVNENNVLELFPDFKPYEPF